MPPPSLLPTLPSAAQRGPGRDEARVWQGYTAGTIVFVVLSTLSGALMVALLRIKLPHLPLISLSVLPLSWIDFTTDVLFIDAAYNDEVGSRTVGLVAVITVVLMCLCSCALAVRTLLSANRMEITMPGQGLLDLDELRVRQNIYAAILLFSCTNPSILVLLPWRKTHFCGFPTTRLLTLTLAISSAEALIQMMLQIAFLSRPGHSPAAISMTILSLGSSLISLLWRLVRQTLKLAVVVSYPSSKELIQGPQSEKRFPSTKSFKTDPNWKEHQMADLDEVVKAVASEAKPPKQEHGDGQLTDICIGAEIKTV